MSRSAWVYLWSMFLAAGALSGGTSLYLHSPQASWPTVALLTLLATLSQLFKVDASKDQSYFATPIFFFAGVLLLDPANFVLLVVSAHLIEWLKERWIGSARLRTWYGQPFNIAKHCIAGLTTMIIHQLLYGYALPFGSAALIIATLSTVACYILLNQVLLGLMLVFANGISIRTTMTLEQDTVLTEGTLAALGYVVALHWYQDPWVIVLALTPLVLVYRALTLHQLKTEARTDSKTGLWNARHFATLLTRELERATRFQRPFAVLMADLDLLRNINNTYGHLAGDTVLAGIGKIIPQVLRDQDIPARFGGEEFAIVLPDVMQGEAMAIAERLRGAIADATFEVSTSPVPIGATMSIGVACFPADGETTTDLVHAADVAVYQAKIQGRNQVICHAQVPHSVKLDPDAPMHRLDATTSVSAAFTPRPSLGQGKEVTTPGQSDEPVAAPAPALTGAHARPLSSSASETVVPPLQSAPPMTPVPLPHATELPSAALAPPVRTTLPLHLLVSTVVVAGLLVTAVGVAVSPWAGFAIIALLAGLIMLAEVFQINVYGENSMSVGMAIFVAAALIGGIPGLAVVSAAAALTDHLRKRRPLNTAHKTLFNWATHVLAGTVPVLALGAVDVPLSLSLLPILLPLVLLASLGYFAIESWLISSAIASSQHASAVTVWRGQFQWLAKHYLVLGVMGLFLALAYLSLGYLGLLVFTGPVWMLRLAQKQYVERTQMGVQELKRVNHELELANGEVTAANRAIHTLNGELFLTLGKILDTRDPYVGSHAGQVADYATAIAAELGLSPERIEQVRQAGFLHDIGKIGIPEAILHKPAKLTDEEYEVIKRHAQIGGELVVSIEALRHLAPFVRHHHERWDGRGYPDGLAGEAIPLEARILNVCDSVEAMASDRSYKRGMSRAAIIEEVQRCAGSQFDPVVAEVFIRVVDREGEQVIVNSAVEVHRRQAVVPAAGGTGRVAQEISATPA